MQRLEVGVGLEVDVVVHLDPVPGRPGTPGLRVVVHAQLVDQGPVSVADLPGRVDPRVVLEVGLVLVVGHVQGVDRGTGLAPRGDRGGPFEGCDNHEPRRQGVRVQAVDGLLEVVGEPECIRGRGDALPADAVQLDLSDDNVQGRDLPDLERGAAHEVDPAAEDGHRRCPLDRQDELGMGQPRVRGRPTSVPQPAGAMQAFSRGEPQRPRGEREPACTEEHVRHLVVDHARCVGRRVHQGQSPGARVEHEQVLTHPGQPTDLATGKGPDVAFRDIDRGGGGGHGGQHERDS